MNIPITPLDDTQVASLQHKIDTKTKPLGSLGRIETLAAQLGRIQQTDSPSLSRPHVVVFAGDHGAAKAGISAYPQDVTWQMVENFLAGGAAINVFARQAGVALRVVDAGVAHEFGKREGLINAKIGAGTANYLEAPAMSGADRDKAIAYGRQLAHTLAKAGCNAIGFGEMGIGNTASASLITHCIADIELPLVIGRGTGLDDAALDLKNALLAQAVRRGGRPSNPLDALAEYGGFEIAMMTGAIMGAAEKRMVILIDGFIVTAALLVAHALIPHITDYCVFAHRSGEPGHELQLMHLNAVPLLDLGLRLGEGTGAALAFPLLQAAVGFLVDMASFDSAGVSDKG
ncbi:nicotinate-nucleotide--dimethylbenzimidazole phosphoribosyltransferase [Nitrogeniibacter aestuarii]|uniref:nicotinate-nucleotide--dimethylbenzimidazole phosphoribosyltransferase n=1 Tax=Nitrogeniibacter aestuarii TaxID=2815343 RepID=UPI001D112FDA|nr:nicotinate-nucleotide--dimethylbenzimidazole phosphoribosyltransferase [Nitrogeniibacter aestuarii]